MDILALHAQNPQQPRCTAIIQNSQILTLPAILRALKILLHSRRMILPPNSFPPLSLLHRIPFIYSLT